MTTKQLWRREDEADPARRGSARPIRVLEIANGLSLAHGGSTANAIELHAALNRRPEVSSHLISARGDGGAIVGARIAAGGAPARAAMQSRVGRIVSLLTTCDVVVLHGYYVWWAPAIAAIARLVGRSVVVIPHGSLTRHQRRFSRGRKRVWEMAPGLILRRCSDAFIVGSAIEREELSEVFPRSTVLLGGAGTDLPDISGVARPDPGDGVDSPVRLLSLSRIAPKKRIDLMIDAVAELQRRGVASRLTVAGEGDPSLAHALRERATRAGVAGAVDFVGMVAGTAKEQAYADAQYFLAPSDDENFGISPAEGLARGVPCIASTAVASASGLPDEAGVLLTAPTGATIADAVQRLLGHDQSALRAAARTFAETHFNWDVVAAHWSDLLVGVRGRRDLLYANRTD